MSLSIHPDAIVSLITGEMGVPASLLGRHQLGDEVSIRSFRPWAKQVDIVNDETGRRLKMTKSHADGLFVVALDAAWADISLSFRVDYP